MTTTILKTAPNSSEFLGLCPILESTSVSRFPDSIAMSCMLNVRLSTIYPFSHSSVAVLRSNMFSMLVLVSAPPQDLTDQTGIFSMSLSARPWCPNGSDWTGLCYNQDKVLVGSTYTQEVRCCKNNPCPGPQAPPMTAIFSSHSKIEKLMRYPSHGLVASEFPASGSFSA